MQYKFFRIPVNDSAAHESELNAFLRANRLLAVHREFVPQGGDSFWAIVVEYLGGEPQAKHGKTFRGKVDYQQILDEQQFALFKKLRELRKKIAEDDGVPVYTIFTNEQLAAMVQRQVTSKSAMGEIEGVGEGKLQKYAERFLALLEGDGS